MSLGVLNNLNAVYAENNLNSTSNSLSKVLQQLSSGSKINSGADDAAGLSLVDGLQANSVALSQSKTNAEEGVGLLQVADGALSQVTSLLNRAVTLATEASNGTLNSSQDTAANQEYQSILSEINNIGTTTTYNDTSVFGQASTNIYTGDSSTTGASIDSLNISSLSSSNVGDSGGVMAYSNGQSSVFLNLSTSTQNAQSTDTLNASGNSTINVNYLVKGANGSATAASTSISVGGTSGYSNTAGGLISAINDAGLGLTANFTTQAAAGISGGKTETGIQISGGLISVGVDPSAASTSGTLNPSEITNGNLTVGQTITVNTGSATAASVTIGQTNDTLAGLAAAINEGTGGAGGVTATVVTDSTGKATSLQLSDNSSTGGALTVTTTVGTVAPNALTPGSVITSASDPTGVTFAAGATGAVGVQGAASLTVSGAGSNNPTQALTGSITLSNGSNTQTYTMGVGASNATVGNVTTLSAANSTLAGLAATMSLNLGATATATTSGIAITSTATGTSITQGTSSLQAVLSVGAVSSNVGGAASTAGTQGTTNLSMIGDNKTFKAGDLDNLAGGFSITAGGVTTAVVIGSTASYAGNTLTTAATNADSLVAGINANAGIGVTAAITGGQIVLTSIAVNTPVVVSGLSGLTGVSGNMTQANSGSGPTVLAQQSVNVMAGNGVPGATLGSLTQSGDALSGSITVNNGGTAVTYTMSTVAGAAGSGASNTFSGSTFILNGANSTLSGLMSAINGGITDGTTAHGVASLAASLNNTAGAATSGLTLTATNNGAANVVVTNSLSSSSAMNFTTPALGGSSQFQSGLLNLQDGGILSSVAGDSALNAKTGTLGGSVTVTSVVNGQSVTDTFNMGGLVSADTATNFNTGGTTLASLMTAINKAGANTGNLDLTASQDAATGGIFLQSTNSADTGLAMDTANLTNSLAYTASAPSTVTYTPTVVTLTGAGTSDKLSRSDLLSSATALQLTNSAANSGTAITFTMGTGTASDATHISVGTSASNETMGALIDAIQSSALGLNASINATTGKLEITSRATGGAGTVTVGTNTVTEAYSSSAATTSLGTAATAATSSSASINTAAGMTTTGTDALGGQVILQNGSGAAVTFNLNSSTASNGNVVNLTTANSTLNGLVAAINQSTVGLSLGITASINSTTGALQLQSTTAGANHAIAVTGTGLTDATNDTFAAGATGISAKQSTGTINLVGGSNNFNSTDNLTGSISVTANGNTMNYVMGSGASDVVSGSTVTLSATNSTVSGFEQALLTHSGLTAVTSGGAMTLTSNSASANTIGVSNNLLSDSLGNAAATATLGTFSSKSDSVSGQLEYTTGGQNYNINGGNLSGLTVNQLLNEVNYGNTAGTGTSGVNGVTATWVQSANDSSQNGSNQFGSIKLTSNTYGATGNITNYSSGTTINDLSASATVSYTKGGSYDIGVSNVATGGVYDSSIASESAPSGASAANANLTAGSGTSAGVATISYSDGSGQSLSATDLSNQTDAQASLTALNKAITDVAAQDGYIGAQINTLNAVSQVLSTQQENVVAAQNAVQATDYASATSNMSKYEILSQTGISALAQANSMQQEVTKLLQ